jgi:hypothetical protein
LEKSSEDMSIESILAELTRERDRLDHAIVALSGKSRPVINRKGISGRRAKIVKAQNPMRATKRRGLTLAGRKKLSDAMKKRWAERKKKGQKSL